MIHKVYLCDSDSVFDVAAFEKVFTENEVAGLTKADLLESIEILKAENDLVKATQAPKGHTWSQELQRKNMPARWITYGGHKLLIKETGDGKGRVIFSANPSLEHLVIIPKTHEEFEQIKRQKKQAEEKRRKKEEVTPEQIQREKEVKKIAREKSQEVTKKFREHLIEVFGDQSVTTKEDIAEVEKKLASKAERMLERERQREAAKAAGDLAESMEKLDERAKKRADKALIEAAEKILAQDARGELVDRPIETKVGVEEVDDKIDLLRKKMSIDDAIQIVAAKEKQKKALKEIRDEFKDDMVMPKGNLEITSTQGIGIVDFNEPLGDVKDKAVQKALEAEENRMRANLNTELYKALEERDGAKGTVRQMAAGAKDTINAMAGEYLEGASLNDEVIEFIGVNNAAKVIANSVSSRKDDAAVAKKIEQQLNKRSQDVVKEVVGNVKVKQERIDEYAKQKDESLLAGATANAAIARQYGAIGRELGFAVGSLETAATVLDSLRDIEGATGDIVVDGGKDIERLKEKLASFGLEQGDYKITNAEGDRKGRLDAIIKKEAHEKMLTQNTFSKQRDATVAAIKSGEAHEDGWNPKGTPKQFTDWMTEKNYNQLKRDAEGLMAAQKAGKTLTPDQQSKIDKYKSFSEYSNKKGQDGYTSQFKEGTKLYGRKLDIKTQDHQQRMIKFGLTQKRAIWNAGAGTGKTFAFLGMMSDIKAQGKLDKSFAVMSPPSRLVKEFYKDAEKFFPHMKMVNLDDVEGAAAKKEVIEYAGRGEEHPKYGKIDIVISGHDSIKSGVGDTRGFIEAKQEEHANKLREEGKWTDFEGWNKGEGKELLKKWKEEAKENSGMPAIIANAKPVFAGVDEAHEVFKGDKDKSSQRQDAIKTIMKDTEYAIPATGTVVRNKIDELGNLLHLTRPDEVPNPRAFSNKWKDVNQFTGVYQSQSINSMAKEYDNIMITEHLKLKGKDGAPAPKYHSNEHKLELTDRMKDDYKRNESIYRQDKNGTGYAVINHDTGEFHMIGDKIQNHDNIPFQLTKKDQLGGNNRSTEHVQWLKSQGFNPKDNYRVVQLGGRNGAAMRRDQRHKRSLNGGDYKTNSKAQKMMENIKASGEGKNHIMFYNNSWSKDMLTNMIKDGLGHKGEIAYIDGNISKAERQKMVTKFQQDDNVKFIVMNKAGMTGLNLQAGDVQHFLERPDSYAEQVQAGARSYRTGREGDVTAHFYDSKSIIDDSAVDRIKRKQKTTEAVQEVKY